jgi:hypothetical protein
MGPVDARQHRAFTSEIPIQRMLADYFGALI